jgi:hypothetical protein
MGKNARWAMMAGYTALALVACGEDESTPPPDPRRSCQDFVGVWCNKNAECVSPSERARVREDCQFVLELDVDCDQIVQVSAGYSQCMAALAQSTCVPPDRISFPSTCNGVLIR